MATAATARLFAVRHGETEWSLSGQHTGKTDVPLTDRGRELAQRLPPVLTAESFALVLTRPLARAGQPCPLSGVGDVARIDNDLIEWDYGAYEGLTPSQ